MLSDFLKAIFAAVMVASCSDQTQPPVSSKVVDSPDIDLSTLVASQTGEALDLAAFLESGEEVATIDVVDGATEEITRNQIISTFPKSDEKSTNYIQTEKEPLSHSTNITNQESFEISLNELNALNNQKDQIIASLTRLNEELILEIQRLRSGSDTFVEATQKKVVLSPTNTGNQLQKLQSEIAMLKSNLLQKSQEIDGLRRQNDQFQNGIDSLQPKVSSSRYSKTSAQPKFNQISVPSSSGNLSTAFSNYQSTEFCSLEFDAVVTLLNGKSKEVFYTEFFLISESLPELLFDEGIFLKDFPQVTSFEQLWAQSRKSPFVFPGIYKRIRNALLSQVEQGRGYRVRTDIDGFAEFPNLNKGSFYLVGTAPVGKTGAVWNLPVILKAGINKASLTLANANWHD